MSTNDFNFNLITGPNMSGKSIFLKQIVLIQVMAQVYNFTKNDIVDVSNFTNFRLVALYLLKKRSFVSLMRFSAASVSMITSNLELPVLFWRYLNSFLNYRTRRWPHAYIIYFEQLDERNAIHFE